MKNSIEHNFTYHAPTDMTSETLVDMRTRFRNLAKCVDGVVEDSREKSLCITKLEEALMWCNAGIVRNQA